MIENPGDKTYYEGRTIEPFAIAVSDPDGDPVEVAVFNLPDGLTWSSETGVVSGTPDVLPPRVLVQAYEVTVTADGPAANGTYVVTATFMITIRGLNRPPTIEDPGDRTFYEEETIRPFPIVVTDPDGDPVEVTLENLPDGLTYSSETGMVSGTPAPGTAVSLLGGYR